MKRNIIPLPWWIIAEIYSKIKSILSRKKERSSAWLFCLHSGPHPTYPWEARISFIFKGSLCRDLHSPWVTNSFSSDCETGKCRSFYSRNGHMYRTKPEWWEGIELRKFLFLFMACFLIAKHDLQWVGNNWVSLVTQLVKKKIHLQCRRPWFDFWVRKIHWRSDRLPTPVFLGFSWGSDDKESTRNAGGLDSILGLGRSPGGRKWLPTPVFCPKRCTFTYMFLAKFALLPQFMKPSSLAQSYSSKLVKNDVSKY